MGSAENPSQGKRTRLGAERLLPDQGRLLAHLLSWSNDGGVSGGHLVPRHDGGAHGGVCAPTPGRRPAGPRVDFCGEPLAEDNGRLGRRDSGVTDRPINRNSVACFFILAECSGYRRQSYSSTTWG